MAILLGSLVAACGDPELGAPDFDAWVGSTGTEDPDSSADDGTAAVPRCEGKTQLRYDPLAGGIDALPDDVLTEDASTATGLKVRDLSGALPEDEPWGAYPSLLSGLSTLSGFGTAAPLYFRVAGVVDPASLPMAGAEMVDGSGLVLLDIDASPPARVEFDLRLVEENFNDDAVTVFVEPLRPLEPRTRYALAVTAAVTDLDGDCVAPSETMASLLDGTARHPTLARVADRYADATAAALEAGVVDDAGELSGLYVFTTRDPTAEATDIAEAIAYAAPPPMTPHEGCLSNPPPYPYRECDLLMKVAEFTNAAGVVSQGANPVDFIDLPATAFFPVGGQGPWPVVIFGHGLWGNRNQGWFLAYTLASSGFAVIAIDAPKHGDHPDEAVVNSAFDLLGLTGDPADPFAPLSARDNFRQAMFDKLQLLRRIEEGLDVDGDGSDDFDPDQVYYVGNSLGAVMAPGFLAYAPQVRAAGLVVGGAKLTDIVTSDEFTPLVVVVTPDLTDGQRARFLAVTQTILDEGEPEVYAGHVLHDRFPGFEGNMPQILAQMAIDDTIVTNTSSTYLARALGLDITGNAPFAMREVEQVASLPVTGNIDAYHTGGIYQYPEVYLEGSSSVFEPATHYNVQGDPGALEQLTTFLSSSATGGPATIIEPYR